MASRFRYSCRHKAGTRQTGWCPSRVDPARRRLFIIDLAALNEKYETYLKVIKVEYRQQFIAFVTQRQEQLRKEIDERRKAYVEDDTERWNFYQQHQGLPSAHSYRNSVQEETAGYLECLNKLLKEFQSIVDEKINSYRD